MCAHLTFCCLRYQECAHGRLGHHPCTPARCRAGVIAGQQRWVRLHLRRRSAAGVIRYYDRDDFLLWHLREQLDRRCEGQSATAEFWTGSAMARASCSKPHAAMLPSLYPCSVRSASSGSFCRRSAVVDAMSDCRTIGPLQMADRAPLNPPRRPLPATRRTISVPCRGTSLRVRWQG